MNEKERAEKYVAKVPTAGSGMRNQGLNKLAYALLERFELNESEHRDLCAAWARLCDPPINDSEASKTITSAWKGATRKQAIGTKKKEFVRSTQTQTQPPAIFKVPEVVGSPSGDLRKQLQAALDGQRYAVEFPWPMLSRMTNALTPGAITLLVSPQGSSKSFFILESGAYWTQREVPVRLLELEDDRSFHTRRVLAQQADEAQLTDDGWCREHPNETKSAWEKHAKLIDVVGQRIDEAPDRITVDIILNWIGAHAQTNRILVVDPISAKDPSPKPWLDDQRMIMDAKRCVKGRDCSLIFVAHPPKGSDGSAWGDDVAGGAALARFAHTVIFMRYLKEPEMASVTDRFGDTKEQQINRKLQIRKARSGSGQGMTLGYAFSSKNLRHYEMGLVRRQG